MTARQGVSSTEPGLTTTVQETIMASNVIQFPRRAANDNTFLPPAVAMALMKLPRRRLAAVAEFAIDIMDQDDGDPDLECAGDELDGSCAEDDFGDFLPYNMGPGCPVSDPGGGNVEDEGECDENSWAEAA